MMVLTFHLLIMSLTWLFPDMRYIIFQIYKKSISEISRVIKSDGFLFISDPTPNVNDTSRFVDGYMQQKKMVILSFIQKTNGYKYAERMGCSSKNLLTALFGFRGKKIQLMDLMNY